MKKFVFIFFLFAFVGISAIAQNIHREYFTPSGAKSAVTVIQNNGDAFIFKTFPSGNSAIEVIPIDPNTMQPTVTPICHSIINTPLLYISLNGVFEDFNGDIVVYGYCNDAHYGFLGKFNGTQILDVEYIQVANTELISGCCGYDQSGNMCYAFANIMGEAIRFDNNFLPINDKFQITDGYISCISWDNVNRNYIFSGNIPDANPSLYSFIGYFDDNFNLQNIFAFEPLSAYPLTNSCEQRTLHYQVEGNEVVLCQQLRIGYPDNMDAIWLTRLNYMSGQVSIMNNNIFPSHKLLLYDIAYNSEIDNIYILGRYIPPCAQGSTGKNCIVQVDASTLSGLRALSVIGLVLNPQCLYGQDTYNSIYLKQMIYNPNRSSIVSTGVYESAYTTETIDMGSTQCDKLINIVYDMININRVNVNTSQYQRDTPTSLLSIFFPSSVILVETCPGSKSATSDNYDNDKIVIGHNDKQIPSIRLIENSKFVCENFTGEFRYYIYDMMGRLIQNGDSENGKLNGLTLQNEGLYLISVIDQSGTMKSKKVICQWQK